MVSDPSNCTIHDIAIPNLQPNTQPCRKGAVCLAKQGPRFPQALPEQREHLKKAQDHQLCTDSVTRVAQPVLDMVSKATGWDVNLFVGGPERADRGRLKIISIHSRVAPAQAETKRSRHAAFERSFVSTFGNFMKECFPPEDCLARAASNENGPVTTLTGLDKVRQNYGVLGELDVNIAETAECTTSGWRAHDSMAISKDEASSGSSPSPSSERNLVPPIPAFDSGVLTPEDFPPSMPLISTLTSPERRRPRLASESTLQNNGVSGTTFDIASRAEPISAAADSSSLQQASTVPSPSPTSSSSSTTSLLTSSIPSSSSPPSSDQPVGSSDVQLSPSNKRPCFDETLSSVLNLSPTKRSRTELNSSEPSSQPLVASSANGSGETSMIIPPLDAPKWFANALDLLQHHDLESSEWLTLVRAWSDLQAEVKFKDQGCLRSAHHRPSFIKDWIRMKRSSWWTPWSAKAVIIEMEEKFEKWWLSLQPEWRLCGPRSRRSKCVVMRSPSFGSWKTLLATGENGLYSVVAALYFWGWALKGKKGAPEYNRWLQAVEDVQFALVEMQQKPW